MKGWLLTYRVPKDPSTARVTLWRRTKQIGGLLLQQSVCFLPDRDGSFAALNALAEEVRSFGGEAHLLYVEAQGEEGERLLSRLRGERDAEYAEFFEQADLLSSELTREIAAGKFTFAELEDMESALERLRTWLARIETRDVQGSTSYQNAAHRLSKITEEIGTFAGQVYQHEAEALRGDGDAE